MRLNKVNMLGFVMALVLAFTMGYENALFWGGLAAVAYALVCFADGGMNASRDALLDLGVGAGVGLLLNSVGWAIYALVAVLVVGYLRLRTDD